MDKPIDFSRMPDAAPPDDLWPAIAGALDRSKRRRLTQRLSALAAMVTVVVLATVLVETPTPPQGEPTVAEAGGPAEVTLADLRAASAWLENRLSVQRQRPVGGLEVESLMWLEAELAWLDEQLADAPQDRDLWQQRVALLTELNQRYAGGDWRREMLLASV